MAADAVAGVRIPARLPVPDLPRADGRADRAAARPAGRALRDPPPGGAQDRPAGARLRHGDPPDQERHADHGRRAGAVLDRVRDAAVVRPVEPLRLDRAVGHAGLRRHRLGRRLAQGGAQGPGGHALAREVLLAVGGRPGRGASTCCSASPRAPTGACCELFFSLGALGLRPRLPAQDQPAGALLQGSELPARRHRLRDPDLPA